MTETTFRPLSLSTSARRLSSFVALLLLVTMMLVACGGSNSGSVTPPATIISAADNLTPTPDTAATLAPANITAPSSDYPAPENAPEAVETSAGNPTDYPAPADAPQVAETTAAYPAQP